ncbi:MAG: hypothetical protein LQ352_002452 [Teloschistes flavicans]|nr:MAG: hypothetical protein LQ352_002452 [Teloschistes flavicans]
MDVAVSMTSSEHAPSSYDPIRSTITESPSSVQAQRSLQQSMSDLTSTHSPRRFHTSSSRTSPTPPSFHQLENIDMDLAPLAPQPDSRSTWRATNHSASSAVPDGQDHDRMETDEEDNDSSSEEDPGDHNQEGGQLDLMENNHTSSEYDEVMDTAPDEPHGEDSAAPSFGSPPRSPTSPPAVEIVTSENMATSTHVPDELHPAIVGAPPTTVATPPTIEETSTAQLTTPSQEATGPTNTETTPTENAAPQDAAASPPAAAGETSLSQPASNEQGTHERPEGREDEESQDGGESSDEEERPYWADFVEDTSMPSERELKLIEEDGQENDALDYPEYIPGDSGRITWIVNPVHGTPTAPNRERIMKSPAVLIGGHYWSIKYYPRGNDGTEHMSVYLECSPTAPKDEEAEKDPEAEAEAKDVPVAGDGAQSGNEVERTATERDEGPQASVANPAEPTHSREASETKPDTDRSREQTTWEVAAQVGCVVYNPNEPRVNTFRKSSHAFNPQNSDWGWTRFHGPWETIHQRQRNQRSALLRNDTLAFTAYIRTVKDDTKNLWWHAPKKGADWDSYERIGVKSLATGSSKDFRDNAIIAAISCWLHLLPIIDLIEGMAIPSSLGDRKRPLFAALQQLLQYMFSKPEETGRNSMMNFVAWLDWYSTETNRFRFDMPDPVAVWDTIRRLMNYEAFGSGDMATASDCLQQVLLLKQPDPWKDESPIFATALGHDSSATTQSQPKEPRSVQETVDLASASDKKGQSWPGFVGQDPKCREMPSILQIELHRQQYDKKARHWDKLTHRIELNEQITYQASEYGSQHDYTLFGMVVHSGGLDSQDFYSVVRPQGPGTRWIKYSGGNLHREASCLTTTQAVTAHEGKGNSSTGNAAVAYVVLYVRTDMLSGILVPCDRLSMAQTPLSQSTTKPEDTESEEEISIRTYRSTIFNSYMGRGLPDLWSSEINGLEGPYFDLRLPKSTTLLQITERLDSLHPKEVDDNECNLYYLEIGLNTSRGLPRLVAARPSDTVEQVASRYDGCRIWVHYQPEDKTQKPEDVKEDEGRIETQQAPSESQTVADEPADADHTSGEPADADHTSGEPADAENTSDEPVDAEMTQEPPVETPVQNGETEAQNEVQDGSRSPQFRSDSPIGDAASPTRDEARPTSPLLPASTEAEDAVMADTDNSMESEQSGVTPKVLTVPYTYFFVKLFDSQAQTLQGVGSKRVPSDSDIYTQVTAILGSEDSFDIFHESSRCIHELDRVRSGRTFEAQDPRDGCVYIAQRRPTAEETDKLVAEGKHPDPISYFTYLRYYDDPSYLNSHYADCSFGTAEYQSISVLNGLIHGQGTIISPSGDVYTGNFVSNARSGQGTMAYSNGDTYVGSFAANDREGQGTMTYNTTNNVYEGGWKKGRRHGKGTMKFEVADEEMQICKICYENEIDAVFYDCGHVVACEECARQVDHCPICRKGVRGVCRIWRT